jgi:spermidine/putrescine transport system substrate-binding protein
VSNPSEERLTARWRRLAAAAATLAAALAIAACGGDDDTVGGGSEGDVPTAEGGNPTGSVTISNWPGYIDLGKEGTVNRFEEATGVETDYIEDVNDNNQFFGKLRPLLEQGESGGRSMFVVTDWMAKQMYDLGYLQRIDYADIPTVDENMTESARQSIADPERSFTVPWQSGLTGLWVDTEKAPEIRSVNDIFDPKYKGKVTFNLEMRDTVPLVMMADGIDPQEATKEEWLDAIAKLKDATESGQIRRWTGNDYTEDLTAGNAVASIGWSGDAYLIGNKDAEWRNPTEGCTIFTDSAVIPRGAPNPAAALAFLDFAYRPEIAANIAVFVTYVTPVEGVKEVLQKKDPATANNPLVFPDEQFLEGCVPQPEPPGSPEDIQEVTDAFADATTG